MIVCYQRKWDKRNINNVHFKSDGHFVLQILQLADSWTYRDVGGTVPASYPGDEPGLSHQATHAKERSEAKRLDLVEDF